MFDPARRFYIHGHRGCKGLRPENSIVAFLHAAAIGADAVEMDVVPTRDNRLAVNHDPIITCNQFESVDQKSNWDILKIYDLDSDQLAGFSRKTSGIGAPAKMNTHISCLDEVVQAVSDYCRLHHLPIPVFNIEIKSSPDWDAIFHPDSAGYAELVCDQLQQLPQDVKYVVQSFDDRLLRELNRLGKNYPLIQLSEKKSDKGHLPGISGFRPWGYSPFYRNIDREFVEYCIDQDIEVFAWTVNSPDDVRTLLEMGVRHFITDFPDQLIMMRDGRLTETLGN